MQQRMLANIQDQLEFTNDTDWAAVEPLVQKILDARTAAGGAANMARLMGGNRGGNRRGGNNPFGGTPNPDAEALQKALDENAPAGQVKELLARYEASTKVKQAALKDAQDAFRAVLTSRQEALATLLGLLD